MRTTPNGSKRPKVVRKPEAAKKGISKPLEVMLEVMREHWAQGQWNQAAAIAKLAAPYVHPRLASIEQKGSPIDVTNLTDEELEFLHRIYRRAEWVSDPD